MSLYGASPACDVCRSKDETTGSIIVIQRVPMSFSIWAILTTSGVRNWIRVQENELRRGKENATKNIN
jgi:hypothetical protein